MKRSSTLISTVAITLALGAQPLISFATSSPQQVNGVATASSVIVSEIYPNSAEDQESGASGNHEFIELYNNSVLPVPLERLQLVRGDVDNAGEGDMMRLDGTETALLPDERLIINPDFALRNDGMSVHLYYLDEAGQAVLLLQKLTYPADLTDDQSLQLQAGKWYTAPPTPQEAMPLLAASPEQAVDTTESETNEPTPDTSPNPTTDESQAEEQPAKPGPQVCRAKNVHISEILPNPDGSDSDGGEFVELYNASETTAELASCTLSTDKLAAHSFSAQDTIGPKQYLSIPLFNDLLNSGGQVTFHALSYNEVITYPDLDSEQTYAKLDGRWRASKQPTPDAANRLPTVFERMASLQQRLGTCPTGQTRSLETHRCSSSQSEATGLKPCAPNQFRNPATNRCKLKDSDDGLKPCDPGQFRNPGTNRCRQKNSDDGLKACDPDQFRNPKTNRCKQKGSDDGLKPCDKDEYRNPETNRCKQKDTVAGGALAESDSDNTSGPGGQSLVVLLVAVMFLLFFLVYEYRHTLHSWFDRFRPKPHSAHPLSGTGQ